MDKTQWQTPSDWGQFLMVGIPGPRLDHAARGLVGDLKVGGVILFARNIEAPEQVWELTASLQQEALKAAGRPLLIAVDQEGGPVQRFKAPFTLIPPARELGARGQEAEVEALARQTAQELALVGVNVNLAPVLDVARGPDCPLWERSYGPDPERVAALGTAAIRGYLAGGVLPVAKHFPGLGDTMVDSHLALTPARSQDPARSADLLPFRRAAALGVPAVMTAHLLVPAWDPAQPATVSPVALGAWLRGNLGFEGVVITDDLEMGAIAASLSAPQAGLAALEAGADLLLICTDWQKAGDTAGLLAREAPPARAREAGARLDNLRRRLSQTQVSREEVKEYFRRASPKT
jgi:beta-N-acetylhexosaminidase